MRVADPPLFEANRNNMGEGAAHPFRAAGVNASKPTPRYWFWCVGCAPLRRCLGSTKVPRDNYALWTIYFKQPVYVETGRTTANHGI